MYPIVKMSTGGEFLCGGVEAPTTYATEMAGETEYSLAFHKDREFWLERDVNQDGDRDKNTFFCCFKPTNIYRGSGGDDMVIFSTDARDSNSVDCVVSFLPTGQLKAGYRPSSNPNGYHIAYFDCYGMDTGGFYNIQIVFGSGSSAKIEAFVNGVAVTATRSQDVGGPTNLPGSPWWNKAGTKYYIGHSPGYTTNNLRASMLLHSIAWVDGQAITDPLYFGDINPNTRQFVPKKNINTSSWRGNSFLLQGRDFVKGDMVKHVSQTGSLSQTYIQTDNGKPIAFVLQSGGLGVNDTPELYFPKVDGVYYTVTGGFSNDIRQEVSFENNNSVYVNTNPLNGTGGSPVETTVVTEDPENGIEVVEWTGTGEDVVIPHNLGKRPNGAWIFEKTPGSQGWGIWHDNMLNTENLKSDSETTFSRCGIISHPQTDENNFVVCGQVTEPRKYFPMGSWATNIEGYQHEGNTYVVASSSRRVSMGTGNEPRSKQLVWNNPTNEWVEVTSFGRPLMHDFKKFTLGGVDYAVAVGVSVENLNPGTITLYKIVHNNFEELHTLTGLNSAIDVKVVNDEEAILVTVDKRSTNGAASKLTVYRIGTDNERMELKKQTTSHFYQAYQPAIFYSMGDWYVATTLRDYSYAGSRIYRIREGGSWIDPVGVWEFLKRDPEDSAASTIGDSKIFTVGPDIYLTFPLRGSIDPNVPLSDPTQFIYKWDPDLETMVIVTTHQTYGNLSDNYTEPYDCTYFKDNGKVYIITTYKLNSLNEAQELQGGLIYSFDPENSKLTLISKYPRIAQAVCEVVEDPRGDKWLFSGPLFDDGDGATLNIAKWNSGHEVFEDSDFPSNVSYSEPGKEYLALLFANGETVDCGSNVGGITEASIRPSWSGSFSFKGSKYLLTACWGDGNTAHSRSGNVGTMYHMSEDGMGQLSTSKICDLTHEFGQQGFRIEPIVFNDTLYLFTKVGSIYKNKGGVVVFRYNEKWNRMEPILEDGRSGNMSIMPDFFTYENRYYCFTHTCHYTGGGRIPPEFYRFDPAKEELVRLAVTGHDFMTYGDCFRQLAIFERGGIVYMVGTGQKNADLGSIPGIGASFDLFKLTITETEVHVERTVIDDSVTRMGAADHFEYNGSTYIAETYGDGTNGRVSLWRVGDLNSTQPLTLLDVEDNFLVTDQMATLVIDDKVFVAMSRMDKLNNIDGSVWIFKFDPFSESLQFHQDLNIGESAGIPNLIAFRDSIYLSVATYADPGVTTPDVDFQRTIVFKYSHKLEKFMLGPSPIGSIEIQFNKPHSNNTSQLWLKMTSGNKGIVKPGLGGTPKTVESIMNETRDFNYLDQASYLNPYSPFEFLRGQMNTSFFFGGQKYLAGMLNDRALNNDFRVGGDGSLKLPEMANLENTLPDSPYNLLPTLAYQTKDDGDNGGTYLPKMMYNGYGFFTNTSTDNAVTPTVLLPGPEQVDGGKYYFEIYLLRGEYRLYRKRGTSGETNTKVTESIGVLVDLDTGETVYYRGSDGSSIFTSSIISYHHIWFTLKDLWNDLICEVVVNMGQEPFQFTGVIPGAQDAMAPTAANLVPHYQIIDPKKFVDNKVITGTTASQIDVPLDFTPDFVIMASENMGNNVRAQAFFRQLGDDRYIDFGTNGVIDPNGGHLKFTNDGLSLFNGATTGHKAYTNNQRTHLWAFKASRCSGIDVVEYTGNSSTPPEVTVNVGGVPEVIMIFDKTGGVTVPVTLSTQFTNGQRRFKATELRTASFNIFECGDGYFKPFNVSDGPAINDDGHEYIAVVFRSVYGFSTMGVYRESGIDYGTVGATTPCGFEPNSLFYLANNGASMVLVGSETNQGSAKKGYLDLSTTDTRPVARLFGDTTPVVSFHSYGFRVNANEKEWTSASGSETFYMAFADTPWGLGPAK